MACRFIRRNHSALRESTPTKTKLAFFRGIGGLACRLPVRSGFLKVKRVMAGRAAASIQRFFRFGFPCGSLPKANRILGGPAACPPGLISPRARLPAGGETVHARWCLTGIIGRGRDPAPRHPESAQGYARLRHPAHDGQTALSGISSRPQT